MLLKEKRGVILDKQSTQEVDEKARCDGGSAPRRRAEERGRWARGGIFSKRMEMREIVQKRLTEAGILKRNFDIGPEVAERVASIVMRTLEKVTEERTFVTQEIECVGELHLTSRIWWHLSDKVPDGRFEDIAAENAEPRGCAGSRRLFNKPSDAD